MEEVITSVPITVNEEILNQNIPSDNIIEELEFVLEKEEETPIPVLPQRRKRIRPSNKNINRLSRESLNLHNKRQNKTESLYWHIYQTLKDNPDYIGISYEDRFGFISVIQINPFKKALVKSESFCCNMDYKSLFSIKKDYFKFYAKTETVENVIFTEISNTSNWEQSSYDISRSKFFIVNFKKLLLSEGKVLSIREKSEGLTYKEIIPVKKKLSEIFKRIHETINTLKGYLSFVYDEQDYDIVVIKDLNDYIDRLEYRIAIRFSDIIIRNSLEDERNIGTIITYLKGFKSGSNSYHLRRVLYGIKQKYSVPEVLSSYIHSHLHPNAVTDVCQFCLGESNLFKSLDSNDTLNEIDFVSIFLAIQDYIKWESLEGGPYIKMETVSILKIINDQIIINPDIGLGHSVESSKRLDLITIISKNIDAFKSIFKLIKTENNYTFTYNPNDLYETIGNMFNDESEEDSYMLKFLYNSNNQKIYSNNNISSDWDLTVIKAQKRIKSWNFPAYFKGNLTLPVLDTEIGKEELISSVFLPIPHPRELHMIANAFVELLNKTLDNDEYKNRI